MGKFCCTSLRSLPPKGGLDHVEPVLLLNVGEVLGERVGVQDVRRLNAVQDHVHDRDNVSERLLFLAVERAVLERGEAFGGELALRLEVLERLAQEARRTDRAVINALADLGLDRLDDGADERARGVILAAVPAGVAHIPDLGFVEMGHLVLFVLGSEAEFVDMIDDLAQVVAALDLVLDLAEDLADLVFDGVRPGGPLPETV
jgi:hypothetical protein